MSDSSAIGPADPAFWALRWQTGETRWDLGGAYPGVGELVHEAQRAGHLPQGSRILEPGAGRAHTGAALAGLGFQVTSFDVVDEAIAAARQLYALVPGLTLVTGDALVINPIWKSSFAGIFDRAVLCALPEPRRRLYAQACFEHLAPGGVFLSSVVTERRDHSLSGPPFAVSEASLEHMLRPGFERIYSRVIKMKPDTELRVAKELLTVWRRCDVWKEDA